MPTRPTYTGRSDQPRPRFAEELQLLRAGKGVSLREAAEQLGWDASTLGKMERGRSLGSPEIVQALERYYELPPGLLVALWELAVGGPGRYKGQYRQYMALEAEAVSLWHHGVSVLPGMLQTDGYARELLALGGYKGADLDEQVEARAVRRTLLEEDDAPAFRSVLAEAVLRTPLRDVGEWRGQLEHLLEMSELPNVTIQVVPQRAGLHGLVHTDVMFLQLLGGRTIVYMENAVRGELVEENMSVERLHRAYDAMRDLALNPAESRQYIQRTLEEVPCEPST